MTRKTNTYKDKKYFYYYCPTGKKHGCKHPTMLKEDDLVQCVLQSLQAHIRNVISLDTILDSLSEEQLNHELIAEYKAQIADNETRLEQVTRFKATLYENFIGGLLDKNEYKTLKDSYVNQSKQIQEAICRLRQEIDTAMNFTNDRLKWVQHFKQFSTMTELDRRAVIALIESIMVISKTELKITFRYQLEYEAALYKLGNHEATMKSEQEGMEVV